MFKNNSIMRLYQSISKTKGVVYERNRRRLLQQLNSDQVKRSLAKVKNPVKKRIEQFLFCLIRSS